VPSSPSSATRSPRSGRGGRTRRADLWPAVEAGTLTLPIYKTFKLADIVEALSVMTANQHFGKIVISIA
jgi:NADPH2:quinone reductase